VREIIMDTIKIFLDIMQNLSFESEYYVSEGTKINYFKREFTIIYSSHNW